MGARAVLQILEDGEEQWLAAEAPDTEPTALHFLSRISVDLLQVVIRNIPCSLQEVFESPPAAVGANAQPFGHPLHPQGVFLLFEGRIPGDEDIGPMAVI